VAEVGLLKFARVALEVARSVLPACRSRFSKRQFNQPQLLAVLCRMRYEDWTFRPTRMRLYPPGRRAFPPETFMKPVLVPSIRTS
jgi:hypothetical protein